MEADHPWQATEQLTLEHSSQWDQKFMLTQKCDVCLTRTHLLNLQMPVAAANSEGGKNSDM